jgi:mannosyl-oligosaccharide alpha-1,2-mannosidase
LTGIGPNGFSWDSSSVPRNQTEFYERAGFFITDSYYVLRPEVIESFYYAYRATGNRTYQDVGYIPCHGSSTQFLCVQRCIWFIMADHILQYAWNAFFAINNTVRMGSGFSSVTDVNAPGGGASANFQESFLFAEVLKYSYLIQSNQDDEWHVNHNGANGWVFNTEAHPMKVRKYYAYE